MTAFSLVSKARVEGQKYKDVAQTIARRARQPRPNPRNRPPEAENYEEEEIELAVQQVQWLYGNSYQAAPTIDDGPIYDIPPRPRTIEINDQIYQSILEINESIGIIKTIEQNILSTSYNQHLYNLTEENESSDEQ